MIESQKYTSVKGLHYAEGTELTAKLRFKSEVPPNNRGIIRRRMVTSWRNGGNNVYYYLGVRGFAPEGGCFRKSTGDYSVYLYISRKPVRLGLDIKAISDTAMTPIEQIVDLKELNKFILTGELPKQS